MAFFEHFWVIERYTYLTTLSKLILAVILRDQPFLNDRQLTRYRKSCNFVIMRPQKTKKCIFRALSVVWGVYISQNTYSKAGLAVILRDQPTSYDQWFARYGFRAISGAPLPPIFGNHLFFSQSLITLNWSLIALLTYVYANTMETCLTPNLLLFGR